MDDDAKGDDAVGADPCTELELRPAASAADWNAAKVWGPGCSFMRRTIPECTFGHDSLGSGSGTYRHCNAT